jgi:hypothetical protein
MYCARLFAAKCAFVGLSYRLTDNNYCYACGPHVFKDKNIIMYIYNVHKNDSTKYNIPLLFIFKSLMLENIFMRISSVMSFKQVTLPLNSKLITKYIYIYIYIFDIKITISRNKNIEGNTLYNFQGLSLLSRIHF